MEFEVADATSEVGLEEGHEFLSWPAREKRVSA